MLVAPRAGLRLAAVRKDIFVVVPTLTAYCYTYKANSEQEHAEQSSLRTDGGEMR